MEFDWTWLLIAFPVAFALGWLASRIDLRQLKRSDRDSPRAFVKGLNLLLNEQPDKAIDAFIEAVQGDPDTSELHFALGGLFRRRGEFERAIRVHEHLLQRGDLGAADRVRAQHALAQDFMKAGLFDRAEAAFRALDGTLFHTEARLARLSLAERSRDWRAAAEIAAQLEQSGSGSFATRIAHYHCELALEADDRGNFEQAELALRNARAAAPLAARPLILMAQRRLRAGQGAQALELFGELRQRSPESFVLVAQDFVDATLAAGDVDSARTALQRLAEQAPGLDFERALARLPGRSGQSPSRWLRLLEQRPSLSAVLEVLARAPLDEASLRSVRAAVAEAARALQRYRCAACGFQTQRHVWQCPGCLSWDSFPPTRVEES
jgi:lipopolysaccharide biosynthesis regulator YciM